MSEFENFLKFGILELQNFIIYELKNEEVRKRNNLGMSGFFLGI